MDCVSKIKGGSAGGEFDDFSFWSKNKDSVAE